LLDLRKVTELTDEFPERPRKSLKRDIYQIFSSWRGERDFPYGSGAISHLNDFMILVPIFMILVPIFHEGDLVGFTSMFGHRRSPYSYEKRSTPSK
jgi:hypothetical protein